MQKNFSALSTALTGNASEDEKVFSNSNLFDPVRETRLYFAGAILEEQFLSNICKHLFNGLGCKQSCSACGCYC